MRHKLAGCLNPHRFGGGGWLQRSARDCRICPEPQSWPTRPPALPATPGPPWREYDVPCERTFRRLLEKVDPEQLKNVLVDWMAAEDPAPLQLVHVDGKVVKNAQPAPARSAGQQAEAASAEPCEVPAELQKPKADKALMLVNFQTTDQRLVDQVAVPRDTNEEAAVAAHLPKMDLAGVCFDVPTPRTRSKPIAAN